MVTQEKSKTATTSQIQHERTRVCLRRNYWTAFCPLDSRGDRKYCSPECSHDAKLESTRRNLEIVRRALEHYLSQVTSALALLNEKEHLVAIRHLKTAEKWHQDALADVNRQLRTGDHLPG